VAVYQRKLAEIDDGIRLLLARRAEVAAQLSASCEGCLRKGDT